MKFTSSTLVLHRLMSIASGQDPLIDQTIKDAVSLWFSNKQAATERYGNIEDWDTSQVTDLSQLFNFYVQEGGVLFNNDISGWNTSSVTTVEYMFNGAQKFNQPIGRWDVSKVENFDFFLGGASSFNQGLNEWNTEKAKTMGFMFMGAKAFNQYIGSWDVSSVEVFNGMFFQASSFNEALITWKTNSATSFSSMFYGASSFNQNIRSWDTSNVANMDLMFMWATAYNQPMINWDVSKVKLLNKCFSHASMFDQNLNGWDVSSATDMSSMFKDASKFERTLCWKNMDDNVKVDDMFCGSGGQFNPSCAMPKISISSRSSCAISMPPTASPAPSMSSSPSLSPTSSWAPTQSSPPTLSILPTAPSFSPPTAENESTLSTSDCGLDFTGYFGIERDKSKSTKTNELVYYYQLTTDQKISKNKAMKAVDELEIKVANTLLPTIFENDCTTMQSKRNLKQPIGIDRNPGDQIVKGVECKQKGNSEAVADENSCYVVKGAFTVYSYVGDNIISVLNTAKEAIESGMDSGSYNYRTSGGIAVRVQHRDISTIPAIAPGDNDGPDKEYVLQDLNPVEEDGGVSENTDGSNNEENDLSWMWALMGISGGLLIFYGILRSLRDTNKKKYRLQHESNMEDQNVAGLPNEDRSLSAAMEKDIYIDQREPFIDELVVQSIESYDGELEDVQVEEPPETFGNETDEIPMLENAVDRTDGFDSSEGEDLSEIANRDQIKEDLSLEWQQVLTR